MATAIILLMWIVKLTEINFEIELSHFGIVPWKKEGLTGIITAPFLHKDLMHLFNNSLPLFIGLISLKYFYPRSATKIILLIWVLTGFFTWLIASHGIHIGASGIVYGCLSFLFFGSLFSGNNNFFAFSLVLIFLYGAMIWGIVPLRQEALISWESHLSGAVAGFINAILFRKSGPPKTVYDWELDEENLDELSDEEIDELIDRKIKRKKRLFFLRFRKNN